jgi:hypothetical protein
LSQITWTARPGSTWRSISSRKSQHPGRTATAEAGTYELGGISVKLSGVWLGGRFPSQVTVSRLNQGPLGEDLTAESVTSTG